MRLANRALFVTLALLTLCVLASAQTPRPADDPRNQSPAVGTGGPEGGPTGLFTIYDGSTIRKGEFTFSVAYSQYHRDPGDVEIQDYLSSFNVGLNDHIELFFKSNDYRQIKVHSPLNLSGFYLPNISSPFGGALPAIILSPSGPNVGTLAGRPLFRPAFNQPFVQFPFTGGSAGTFGLGPGFIGSLFGFPGFLALIGPPIPGSGGNFGPAGTFPGLGAPVGGILPGVVLATAVIPCTLLTGGTGCLPGPGGVLPTQIVVPATYTTRPAYLPDAPFIGRTFGESAFTNFTVGAKIRLTGPNNPLGFGFIPFYRWWNPRNANSLSDFTDMQAGSGPGGNVGDFGLVMFIDGRLSRSVNMSANLGFIVNSNPRSGNVNLLDRPNEFLAGVGFDFPINKHFQPIFEVRSTEYVGGATPNAFPNNPVEAIGGLKIYPRRWFGFGVAYRAHLNQQSRRHLNPTTFSTTVNNLTNIVVPGAGLVVVPPTSVGSTDSTGAPIGFRFSTEGFDGLMAQAWFGHRNSRAPTELPNQPPVISSFTASPNAITLPCPPGTSSSTCTPSASSTVQLSTSASDPDPGEVLLYTYTVTGGRITGEGPNVSWDLSGVTPGTYTATVEVDDGCGCVAFTSTTVSVANCTNCVPPPIPCPTIRVTCPDNVDEGAPITFTAGLTGVPPDVTPTYSWSVSAGTITGGQGTSSITVSTAGLGGQTVTATVDVGGLDASCSHTASCSTQVRPVAKAYKFEEYGNIRFNDEKARLDNYASELQRVPDAQGYIIAYGTCAGEAQARADRAKNYLVNTRGIDAGRLVTVDGGCMPELKVELWIVPRGAAPPTPSTENAVSPCPECKKRPVRRHRVRRSGEEEEED